jgi:DNA-binding NtrC family response regulator
VARAQELVRRAAGLQTAVLLVAERGIAVDSVARELHVRSRHAGAPYVALSCASAEPAQLERSLFGSTGAAASDRERILRDSAIAAARGGTLFLAEVTELPASAQVRLARLLRDGEVQVEGDVASLDIRVVASAQPTIDLDVREHRFRVDLYRRLSISRIDLPSLRDRPDDVPALARRLLADACAEAGRPQRTFTQAALGLLAALTWPGNVAELQAVIAAVAPASTEPTVPVEQLLPALRLDRAVPAFVPAGTLRDARQRFERDYIASVLQHHNWRVAEAAQTLGIQRPNLYRKARQLGIPVARVAD